ncbi:zinc knuckle [Ostertagia ostertagi]
MATSLKARKGLVTRQSNALTDLVKKYSRLAEEVVFAGATDMTKLINEMNSAQVHIRALQASLEKATLAFAETVDSLEIPLGSEEEGRASEHIEKANTVFSESETLLAQFEVQKQIAATRMRENVEESEFHDFSTRSHETSTARMWTARSMDLKDQSKLFDKICSLTKQLESKGENLDSPWLLSKILAKFRKDIQRRVLERKVTLPSEESWNLKLLMDSLDMVIRQEQEIERYMPAKTEHKAEAKQKPGVTQDMKRTPFCFYCESKDHWSTSCTKLKHPNERIDFLKTTHRCLGCGSKSHTFADCKSKGCYYCGKKHHSSTCFKSPIKTNNTPSSGNADPKKGEKIKKTVQNFAKARITAVQENNLGPSPTILAVSESPMKKKHEQIFLLTGHLTVVHPTAQKSMEVEVLFDTGADRSFIDSQLAKDLQLKECGRKVMQLTTFGSHEHKEIECLLTSLRVWDANGEAHTLQLFTFDKLCPNLSQGGLDEKDLEFIRRKHIRLCVPHEKDAVQPKILIGCDQLWDFINFEAPHFNLPSGLTLIPTKFGYTVSGRKTTEGTTTSKPTMSSCALTERYWRIWKDSYLTALREQHRRNINNKKGCACKPLEGEVVLIVDSNQKRNHWKLGRITKLVQSNDGAIREAEVFCGNNSVIKRPINLLIPLEISGTDDATQKCVEEQGREKLPEETLHAELEELQMDTGESQPQKDVHGTTSKRSRYNLRPRAPFHANSNAPVAKGGVLTVSGIPSGIQFASYLQLLVTIISAALVMGTPSISSTPTINNPAPHTIECRPEGIYLHSPTSHGYEICVNNYCMVERTAPIHKIIRIPAKDLLYEYEARWKIETATNYTIIETVCPEQPFCASVNCIICSDNIFNPECWPFSAIAGAGILLYIMIALCYTICYIPVTIGHPIRLLLRGLKKLCIVILNIAFTSIRGIFRWLTHRQTRTSRFLEALALCGIIASAWTCQTVNVFSHHMESYMTLSVLSWPYFSVLDAKFITNTHNTAIWSSESLPHLQCPTRDAAQQLQCNFFDSCECSAAEVQVNCYCESQEIRQHFRKIENLLPVTFPFLKFTKHPRHDVMAQIEDGVSSEIIVNIKGAVDDSVVDSIDEVCKIDDTTIQGCYKCNRGANAVVTCASSSTAVTAEIVCGTETFTVPCAPSKMRSTVRFLLPNARIQLNCTVKCGSTITYFEITGILKTMDNRNDSYDDLLRKRKAEEQRLIEQLRFKRAHVRLTPSLPTEKEVQKKIKQFVQSIVAITQSNNLLNESAEVFGQRPSLFAKGEATLYKCKVQNMGMKAEFVKEKLLSAVQGLTMSYETYGLLILAEHATDESKTEFYNKRVEGISLEPVFVNEFVRKELDFLDAILKSIETEMHEALQQIENEEHPSIHEEIAKAFAKSEQLMREIERNLKEEIQRYEGKLDALETSLGKIQTAIEEKNSATRVQEDAETVQNESLRKSEENEMEEDLLDFDDEQLQEPNEKPAEEPKQNDEVQEHMEQEEAEVQKPQETSFEKEIRRRKRKIRERMSELYHKIRKGRRMPNRIFSQYSKLRDDDVFLRCSFCDRKGYHYSDSCPRYKTVKERKRLIRCYFCLDTFHRTQKCRKDRKPCNYCHSMNHHTAICKLPEERDAIEREYSDLKKKLDDYEKGETST